MKLTTSGPDAPFIAYVNVMPEDGTEHVFITRGQFHPSRRESARAIQYVRYRLPLGKIAETKPGETAIVRVPFCVGPRILPGHYHETRYTVLSRDVFRVQSIDDVLDAVENQIAFPDSSEFVPALRQWISRTIEEIAAEAAKPRRRRIAERFGACRHSCCRCFPGGNLASRYSTIPRYHRCAGHR